MVEIESVCLIEGEEPDPRRKDLFRVEDGVRVVYYTNKDRLSFRIIEHENRYCYYYDSEGRTHRLNGPPKWKLRKVGIVGGITINDWILSRLKRNMNHG